MADPAGEYFTQYGVIAIFAALAVVVPTSMLLIGWALSLLKVRPNKPSFVKNSIYECGFETITERWSQFNFRYYMFALLFVIFDVETVFIYPWAVHFNKLGLFALIEMLIFIAILVIAWLYAWKKRALEWENM